MKWTVTAQHKDFFDKHSFIAFDCFFKEELIGSASEEIQHFFTQHFHQESFFSLTPEQVFFKGRDLSRHLSSVQKIVRNKQLGVIAAELTLKKNLRIGYDQTLLSSINAPSCQNPAFAKLLQKAHYLPEISSIQGIQAGALISLTENLSTLQEENAEFSSQNFFPEKQGAIVFFNNLFPIQLDLLYKQKDALYLLVTFADTNAVYIHNPADPHTHALKSLGLGFGDRLQEKYHPLVI